MIDSKVRHRTKANGNVFSDIGFPPDEAKKLLIEADARIDENARLKRQLMSEIVVWIESGKMTQATAAEALHVTRPRVSDVVNQRVNKFTIDTLINMLSRIGKHVRLAVQ